MGTEGKESLLELFAGKSQLIIYHFMFGPGWEQGCKTCSFLSDHIDAAVVHLAQRDVTLLAVSHAPLSEFQGFKERMGWRFKWVSSAKSDFNSSKLSLPSGPTHTIVSSEDWVKARKDLLAEEKKFTQARDRLSAHRRELPWVKIDKDYVFVGPEGKETLLELFAGKSQLIIYHFMFGPGWEQGCKTCSFLSDHIDAAVVHLAQRDVTLLAVSHAPLSEFQGFKERMGWHFKWVSSAKSDFNSDFHISYDKDELEKGEVYYNYKMQKFPVEEIFAFCNCSTPLPFRGHRGQGELAGAVCR